MMATFANIDNANKYRHDSLHTEKSSHHTMWTFKTIVYGEPFVFLLDPFLISSHT